MKLLHSAIIAAGMLVMTACTSVPNPLNLSVQDKDTTPRIAAVEESVKLTDALNEFTEFCQAGFVSEDLAGVISRHGPTVVDFTTQVFESAEPCVVIDGQLRTDTSVGRTCNRGDIKNVSRGLINTLYDVGTELTPGSKEAMAMFVARRAIINFTRNSDGGVIDGFTKSDDMSAQQYRDALQPLREARDRASVCISSIVNAPAPIEVADLEKGAG